MRKRIEYIETIEGCYYRMHVWTEKGYSSKTFATSTEAAHWLPSMRMKL